MNTRMLRLIAVGLITLALLWLFRVPLFSWTWWIWLPTGIGAFLLLELAACNLRARPRLAAGLVAAVLLALFLLQPVKYVRGSGYGAVCRDGWVSASTGSGTCSHHGGVRVWR